MNNCNDNQELESTLYKEFVFYDENLYDLAHIIRRILPKWAVCRIIFKLKNKRKENKQ